MTSPVRKLESLLTPGRSPETREHPSAGRWLLVAAAAVLLLTIVFVTQTAATRMAAGREVVWQRLIVHFLALWMLWAVLAPLVSRAARWIGSAGWSPKLLLHLPVGAAISCIHIVLWAIIVWWSRGESGLVPSLGDLESAVLSSFGSALTVYLAMVAGAYAFNYYRALRARELESLQLESQLAEARLHSLQGQLQPHFLFNTLHAISALMDEDTQAARRMMSNLSTLLRFSLDQEPGREIPLEKELQMLRQYMEIQKTRFGDRLTVAWNVDPEAKRCIVPHLILQPLVENAIRHGLEPRPGPCHVEIAATLRDGRLTLTVRDDGAGPGVTEIREGVGLSNTRNRLTNLYGDDACLDLGEREGGGTEVTITMPAKEHRA